METDTSIAGSFASLQLKWGWILAIGLILVLLGTVALGDTLAVTFVSVFLLGWLLIASGLVHVVHLIRHTEIRSFWHIVGAILDFIAGFYLVANPALGALTVTLVLAAFFLASGVTRLIGVWRLNLPHKFWPVLNGIVSILLGILLWVHWPTSGLWFIGFAIGIELIIRGWTLVMLAFALRGRPARLANQPA
jgi:uncharacterized membrane protein HdeD (DUF308 family)